jgi:hypothetical protein
MRPDEAGSVTRWIGDLKAGGDGAAQRLWERYFDPKLDVIRQTWLENDS